MRRLTNGQTTSRAYLRSALLLSACIVTIALLLLPYAMLQTGSAGPKGVAAAAAICLVSGLASEGLACLFAGMGTPLAGLLMGMAARMAPPLLICIGLAMQGSARREYLEFVCYLLAFYMVTLTLETWLAVRRVHHTSSDLNHGTR